VLNFEARGSHGASLMFQTAGDDVAWLVERLAGAPRVFASSFFPEAYKRLPNDTDLSVFRRKNVPGYDFAFIEGLAAYHAPTDDVGHLDLRSLQHHGLYALTLTKRLADLPPPPRTKSSLVYFDLFGAMLIRYAPAWGAVAFGLAFAAYAWAIVRAM